MSDNNIIISTIFSDYTINTNSNIVHSTPIRVLLCYNTNNNDINQLLCNDLSLIDNVWVASINIDVASSTNPFEFYYVIVDNMFNIYVEIPQEFYSTEVDCIFCDDLISRSIGPFKSDFIDYKFAGFGIKRRNNSELVIFVQNNYNIHNLSDLIITFYANDNMINYVHTFGSNVVIVNDVLRGNNRQYTTQISNCLNPIYINDEFVFRINGCKNTMMYDEDTEVIINTSNNQINITLNLDSIDKNYLNGSIGMSISEGRINNSTLPRLTKRSAFMTMYFGHHECHFGDGTNHINCN